MHRSICCSWGCWWNSKGELDSAWFSMIQLDHAVLGEPPAKAHRNEARCIQEFELCVPEPSAFKYESYGSFEAWLWKVKAWRCERLQRLPESTDFVPRQTSGKSRSSILRFRQCNGNGKVRKSLRKWENMSQSVGKCQVTHGIAVSNASSRLSHDHHEFTSPELPDRRLRSHFPPSETIDDGRFPNLSSGVEPFCSGST